MVEQRHADEGIQQGGMGKAMKRRGILAAAGAAVAGIVAKQTSQPVAAISYVVLGNGLFDTTTNIASAATRITTNGSAGAAFRGFGTGTDRGLEAISDRATALIASTGEGANATSPDSRAVIVTQYGQGPRGICIDVINNYSLNGLGVNALVYGSGGIGMKGVCDAAFGVGVEGESSSYFGVQGSTDTGIGIVGDVKAGGAGTSNIGVLGSVGSSVPNNQSNTVGVYGQNLATGTGGIGVQGVVNAGSAGGTIAISGTNNSSAPNSHGIVGTAGSGHGLIGNTNFAGAGPPYYAGLIGNAPNGAYAGLFFGPVSITGTLNGHTAIMQHAQVAVAHPDGSHRLSYALSATENWIEDGGKGTLVNGQSTVKIDPAFAAIADTNEYDVFLTAYGDYNLHVAEMKADGFVVRVTSGASAGQPTGGAPVGVSQVAKASSVAGTFSWKVIAKRKDGQAQRLATYTFPKLEAPHIPEPPKAAETKTKP